MPSTSLTEQQLEICRKYLVEFREGDRSTKPSVMKKAVQEMLLLILDVDKSKKKEIRMVSDFHDSKSFLSSLLDLSPSE
jgi:hypothetical protein